MSLLMSAGECIPPNGSIQGLKSDITSLNSVLIGLIVNVHLLGMAHSRPILSFQNSMMVLCGLFPSAARHTAIEKSYGTNARFAGSLSVHSQRFFCFVMTDRLSIEGSLPHRWVGFLVGPPHEIQ